VCVYVCARMEEVLWQALTHTLSLSVHVSHSAWVKVQVCVDGLPLRSLGNACRASQVSTEW